MTPQALLEIESVRSALDAMRQAEPLGVAHPLAHFLCLRRNGNLGATPGGTASTDATIFYRLARVIERRLNHHRALYHLTPVSPHADYDSARAAIKEDFQQHNEELEAWSYLYYRYVRTDLDLSVDDLQSFTVQDRRTLQRRQSKAITRLAHDLARREASARTRYRQATQRARLPLSYETKLVGPDPLLDSLV